MSLFRSSNPALKEKYFQSVADANQGVMTQRGTMNKLLFLFLMVLGSASFTWNAFYQGAAIGSWVMGAAIGGLVLALVICFRPRTAAWLSPAYALVQGVFLGGVSAIYNDAFAKIAPGLVMQSVLLTFGVVLAMYVLYRTGMIKATARFKSIVFMATAGIAVFYLIAMVMRLFGMEVPLIHESSTMGIVFSLVVVAIAALNLIIDFDMIDKGVAAGAPKFMEWFAAFGLLVTIVWLYIEILRLMSKLSGRK